MALTVTAGTPHASWASTSSGATLVPQLGTTFVVGDMVVIAIASDNAGSSGSAACITTASGTGFGSFTKRNNVVYDNGAAAAGAEIAYFWAICSTDRASTDTVTINFSPNTTSKCCLVWNVHSTDAAQYPHTAIGNGSVSGAGATTGTPTLTSGATNVGVGAVTFGAISAETNATVTLDGDTTNGSWSAQLTQVANTGTVATSMRAAGQYKIQTTTDSQQTYNPTLTSCDNIMAILVVGIGTTPTPATIVATVTQDAVTAKAGQTTAPASIATTVVMGGAATFDVASGSTIRDGGGNGTGLTWAHTIAAGTGKGLAVYCNIAVEGGPTIDSPERVVTCTYNGVSMTEARSGTTNGNPLENAGSASSGGCLFYLTGINSDGLSHNIVITVSAGVYNIVGSAVSVNSTSGVDAANVGTQISNGASPSPTLGVPNCASDSLVVGGASCGTSITGSTTGTNRHIDNLNNSTSGSNSSIATNTGSGTVNFVFTTSGSDSWQMIGIEFLAGGGVVASSGNGLGQPATIAVVATLPAVITTTPATPTPATIVATTTQDAVAAKAGQTTAPATIVTTVAMDAATAKTSHTTAPAVIATTVAMDAVTPHVNRTTAPAVIAVPTTMPAVTTSFPATASPPSINVSTAVGQGEASVYTDDWTGTNGNPWTWEDIFDNGNTIDIQSNKGRILLASGGYQDAQAAFDAGDTGLAANWDLYVEMTVPDVDTGATLSPEIDWQIGPVGVFINTATGDVTIIVNNVGTFGPVTVAMADGDVIKMRFLNVDGVGELYVWVSGAQPGTPTVTFPSPERRNAGVSLYVWQDGGASPFTVLFDNLTYNYWDLLMTITSSTDVTPTPASIVAAVAMDAVSAKAGQTTSPATIATVVSMDAVSTHVTTTASPASIVVVTTMDAVTTVVVQDATPTPAAIVCVVTIEQTATMVSAARGPPTIITAVSMDAVAASGTSTATATPTTIVAVVSMDAITLHAGQTGSPASFITTPSLRAMDAVVVTVTSTRSPAAIIAVVSMDTVSASGTSTATATPVTIIVTTAMDAITTQAGQTANPTTIIVPVSMDAVTATGVQNQTATPAAIVTVISMDAVSASGTSGSTAAPASIVVTTTMDAITTHAGQTTSPATIVVVVSMDAVAASGVQNATSTPAVIAIIISMDTVSASGTSTATASPATIVTTISMDVVTLHAGQTTSPTTIVVITSMDAVSASGATAGTATPATIIVVASMNAVTTQAGQTATPASIQTGVTIDQALATVTATRVPNAIVAVVSMDTVTASGTSTATATPASIIVVATLPSVSTGGTASYTVSPPSIIVLAAIDAVVAVGEQPGTATPASIAVFVWISVFKLIRAYRYDSGIWVQAIMRTHDGFTWVINDQVKVFHPDRHTWVAISNL